MSDNYDCSRANPEAQVVPSSRLPALSFVFDERRARDAADAGKLLLPPSQPLRDHGAFENACLAPIPQLAIHRLAVQSNAVLSPGKWTRLVFRVQLLDRAQGYRCHPLLLDRKSTRLNS